MGKRKKDWRHRITPQELKEQAFIDKQVVQIVQKQIATTAKQLAELVAKGKTFIWFDETTNFRMPDEKRSTSSN